MEKSQYLNHSDSTVKLRY